MAALKKVYKKPNLKNFTCEKWTFHMFQPNIMQIFFVWLVGFGSTLQIIVSYGIPNLVHTTTYSYLVRYSAAAVSTAASNLKCSSEITMFLRIYDVTPNLHCWYESILRKSF